MKYAVIRTGGKQYRVSEGDLVKVEKLAGAVGDAYASGRHRLAELAALPGD